MICKTVLLHSLLSSFISFQIMILLCSMTCKTSFFRLDFGPPYLLLNTLLGILLVLSFLHLIFPYLTNIFSSRYVLSLWYSPPILLASLFLLLLLSSQLESLSIWEFGPLLIFHSWIRIGTSLFLFPILVFTYFLYLRNRLSKCAMSIYNNFQEFNLFVHGHWVKFVLFV